MTSKITRENLSPFSSIFNLLVFLSFLSSLYHSTLGTGLPLMLTLKHTSSPSVALIGELSSLSINSGAIIFSFTARAALELACPSSLAAMHLYVPASSGTVSSTIKVKMPASSSSIITYRPSSSNLSFPLYHSTTGSGLPSTVTSKRAGSPSVTFTGFIFSINSGFLFGSLMRSSEAHDTDPRSFLATHL